MPVTLWPIATAPQPGPDLLWLSISDHILCVRCCKDDRQSQWEMAKFHPQLTLKHWTDHHKFATRDYVAEIVACNRGFLVLAIKRCQSKFYDDWPWVPWQLNWDKIGYNSAGIGNRSVRWLRLTGGFGGWAIEWRQTNSLPWQWNLRQNRH